MSVKISRSNSKLGIIPSVNISPVITCRAGAPCAKYCYAMKGRFRFSGVKDGMAANYELYQKDPARYFDEIRSSIDNGFVSYSYFRWHAAGDIVDEQYLRGMIQVANSLPRTSFLAFTKKYELVNWYIANVGDIPSNLNIVFSAWGDLKFENPYSLPVAYVRFKEPSMNVAIPATAVECSGNCTTCLKCWGIKTGESVVFNIH